MIPLRDNDTDEAQRAYEHALRLYQQGRTGAVTSEAAAGWARYRQSDPKWAGAFQLLYARVLYNNAQDAGQYKDVLNLLAVDPDPGATDEEIQRFALEASVFAQLGETKTAEQRTEAAEAICRKGDFPACGGVLMNRAGFASGERSRELYERAFAFAQKHQDSWRQATSSLNLGYGALQMDRLDEAIDWSRLSYQTASQHGYDRVAELAARNLGWAFYQLGDGERALERYKEAEKNAERLGNEDDEFRLLSTTSYVYRDGGELDRAEELQRKALTLAQKNSNTDEEVSALADLAVLETSKGDLKDADIHLQKALLIETAGGRKPHPDFVLMEAELAAAQHEYTQAERLYRVLLSDKASSMLVRLNAGNDLGRMYEVMGRFGPAELEYKATIVEWDAARGQLKHEESQLSFGTNAGEIYRNYVRFLVERGRTAEALAVADQSRARTLAEGLGFSQKHVTSAPEAPHPEQIARKRNATLLFYWLGDKESYLWAVTPERTAFSKLPGEKELAAQVASYNKAIQDMRDTAETANADGLALYAALVAPAQSAMRARRPVILLTDGALSELNFETLLVPGAAREKPHYLVEDATLLSAPSLDLLAHGEADKGDVATKNLLLIGNPAAADADFPPLPLFGVEMTRVAGHFNAGEEKVFAGARATPVAYTAADPGKYAYIHFVSHATASRTSPLDSAIILSNPAAPGSGMAGDQGSPVSAYKLYAREIVAHPLEARLVTISACYGSGTRAYTGEGLVGLSWAFLRAGARQVVEIGRAHV